jgi:hypothetical protein
MGWREAGVAKKQYGVRGGPKILKIKREAQEKEQRAGEKKAQKKIKTTDHGNCPLGTVSSHL